MVPCAPGREGIASGAPQARGRQPDAVAFSKSGDELAAFSKTGLLQLYAAPSAALVASVVPLYAHGGVALVGGAVEFVGDGADQAAPSVVCLVGARAVPLELCAAVLRRRSARPRARRRGGHVWRAVR